MSRISYLARRLTELPPEVLARKAWLRIKPRIYARKYASRRRHGPALPADAVERVMRTLASLARQAEGPSDPDSRARVARRAASVIAGRFEVLGYGETEIPSATDWHRDPFHHYQWPCAYFPEVDFVAAGVRCDVKIPWELSRLQFLVWLAEGAQFKGSDRAKYLARFEEILHDWIAANPPGFGVNWTCGMEVAIRAVNLVFASALVADGLSGTARQAVVGSLVDHRNYLCRFPEYSDVPGNHYLADLMGIAVLDCAIDGPHSARFAKSVAAFAVEADRQFDASGIHLEYATVYHRLCMDMVAIVHALATLGVDRDLAKPLEAVLERAMRFADAIASPGGLLPIFGDSDSGHVLWFGGDARRLSAMRLYCYGEPAAGGEGDFASFLARFRRDTGPLFAAVPGESGVYGPLVTMRNGLVTLVARHGPQGLKGRAPHDHDDALGFWLFLGDEDLFVDAGCLSYTRDPGERRAAITSTGHSVWSPAGRERFALVDGSVFLTVWGAADAAVELRRTAEGLDCELRLRGRLGRSVREERRFTLSSGLRIDDAIQLRSPEPMEMLLRLGPSFTAENSGFDDGIAIVHAAGGPRLQLRVKGEHPIEIEVVQDAWAPQYGRSEKVSAIRIRSAPAAQHAVSWTLVCGEAEAARVKKGGGSE
jgi:hypothetical protein